MERNGLVVASVVLFLILTSPFAFAAPNEHLDWGAQLHSGASSCPSGKPVINVVQKVLNDNDSGVAGNAWAYDDFVRQIQVVETAPGWFCATVKYQGNFTTIAGSSPNNTGTVGDGIVGTFQGGYVSTLFRATLTPPARTKGSIGTFDYACDTAFNCPGYVNWTTLYFNNGVGVTLDLAWWGWVYHAGNNGSWTNAITGNSGDITGD